MFTVRITDHNNKTVRAFEFESYAIDLEAGKVQFYSSTIEKCLQHKLESGVVAHVMNRFGSTVDTIR